MRFFFDNNLSPKFARAIDSLEEANGYQVIHLRDRFDQSTADDEWLRALVTEGDWVVITSDYRITKNPHEVAAWRESAISVFFLRGSWFNIGFWEQAALLVRRWPKIVGLLESERDPVRYVVPVKGAKFEPI